MRQKQEICKYCGEKMESKTTRQEFCSDKCRVYWNRENPKIRLKDLTQPTNVAKPPEQPKTNYSINTLPEETGAEKRPKTLQELKAMCPTDLTGLDRSAWIADNSIKYNI
jgi:hypothetical protein